MFCRFTSLLAVVGIFLSLGQALTDEQVSRQQLKGWPTSHFARDEDNLNLKINLKESNIALLEGLLRQASDPTSLCYGHYLDKEEIDNLFLPSVKSHDEVSHWLQQSGIQRKDISVSKRHISIRVSAVQANRLLDTTIFTQSNGKVREINIPHYYIPPNVAEHIDFISSTFHFDSANHPVSTGHGTNQQPSRSQANTDASIDLEACQTYWTPACLQHIYNTKNYLAEASSGSRIAIAAFLDSTALYADIAQFESLFSLPTTNFSIESVKNGRTSQHPVNKITHLNDLDIFTISSITKSGLPIIQYSVGGSPPPFTPNVGRPSLADNDNEPYLTLFEHLLDKPNSELPQVITASYSEDEQTVPIRYARRVCNAIGMLGLRGVSVIHTMGGAGPGTSCVSNDGQNTSQFTPQFPASCPWITGVGETNQTNPLMTWNITSGGFSWYFDRPWYQEDAVTRYLNESVDPSTLQYYKQYFNAQGRASPEISLQGYKPDDQGIWTGDPQTSSFSGATRGNSALAAITGLLNDARLRTGLPTMGFLNPWLYKYGSQMLTDITLGASLGCLGRNIQFDRPIEGAKLIPWVGWNATEGWDPATGLGFPEDFNRLHDVALNIEGGSEAFGGGQDWCPYRWWEIR